MVLTGGAGDFRLVRVGLRLVVGVFRNCDRLVTSRSSSLVRFLVGLMPLPRLIAGRMAVLPSVGVRVVVLTGVVSSGAVGALLFVVGISSGGDGDGGVCRWQGRFDLFRGGGEGCVRRDGGCVQ